MPDPDPSVYATLAPAKERIRVQGNSNNESINASLADASRLLDLWTGTWYWERECTIKTQSGPEGGPLLFLPAKILELESVSVDGVELVEDVDFFRRASWLERSAGWSKIPNSCVLVGTFGDENGNPLAKSVTIEIMAVLTALKSTSYTSDDGPEKAVMMTELPKWAQGFVLSKRAAFSNQEPYILEETP